MHPKDYKIKDNIQAVKEKYKVDVSVSSFEEELVDSDIVLSCVSSTLVEGLENGVPSFQLMDLKWIDMDEVPDLSINEIAAYRSKYKNFINSNKYYNNDTDMHTQLSKLLLNESD